MRAHALLSRTSLIASAIISLTAVPAFAQDSAGTTASEDEGAIVVTARRREENLVDVPIAISAISGNAPSSPSASPQSLSSRMPGLSMRRIPESRR